MIERHSRDARRSRVPIWLIVLGLVALFGVVALIWRGATEPPLELRSALDPSAAASRIDAEFVGSSACAECHGEETAAWQGSQHQRAMQHATSDTVLGDFASASFTHAGVVSEFLVRDGRYYVRTEGADGKPGEFEIRYTYGVDPLQQYLIEFPDGRLQALTIAWDTRPAEAGGQRWFHLYPHEEIPHDDELHWTQLQQNWNFMCADCHSTDVRKNYDAATDRFATSWAEISVGCEACHGPGSQHVAWATAGSVDAAAGAARGLTVRLDARRSATWRIDPATGSAVRSAAKPHDREMDVCAQCHSRRSQIAEGYHAGKPYLDHYLPALIESPLYWVDGQQRDEVYTWGSFLQSRMYARGVVCSDCHEPHSQQLRAPGNGICAQCHLASKYDGPQHHFHAAGTAGAACVGCHMPPDVYMVIDPRHDHSLRIPRPEETIAYGVPNACNDCHERESARWAAGQVREWYGDAPGGFQQFAGALASAEQGRARAAANLAALIDDRSQPDIIRATAAHRLVEHPDPVIQSSLVQGLNDPDPLVRRGALTALELFPPEGRLQLAAPLLDDPVRIVRIEAAYRLAGVSSSAFSPAQREAFTHAAEEFIAVQQYNADRPEALMLHAAFDARRGDVTAAEQRYRQVIERNPHYVPAYANLADLYRAAGREADAAATLHTGLEKVPPSAALHHALGLSLVRSQQLDRALPELERAAHLDPAAGRYAYVYAVALRSAGHVDRALEVLEAALERGPEDRDLLAAAITFNREAGRLDDALRYARQWARVSPEDSEVQRLLTELESTLGR